MKEPQFVENMDTVSAPPKGYKHFLDASNRDPVEQAKKRILEKFPNVNDIQVFHEAKTDMGGNMLVRFFYNGKPIELPVSYQQIMDTLTSAKHSDLSEYIQNMPPMERGLFNTIVFHIKSLEKRHKAIQTKTRSALATIITDEIQSA